MIVCTSLVARAEGLVDPKASPRKIMARWIAMGFFSWLVVLTFVRDIALLFTDRWVGESAFAILVATPLITAIGFLMARRVARVVDVRVPVEKLHAALEGFTIAQISDVHVGPTIRREFVERIVDRVNGLQCRHGGDHGRPRGWKRRPALAHTAPLANLKSRHGTYVVTGNHEYYSGAQSWIGELERLGRVRAAERARGDRP